MPSCRVFRNTQQGSITIAKDSVPDGPATFDFTASAPLTPAAFTLDDDGDNTNAFSNTQLLSGVVDQQTYTITETPTAGFALSAINCAGTTTAVTDLANHQVAITFHAGDTVVCTFVNDQQGSITIAKDAVPDSPATFDFTAAPLTPAAFTLDDDGDNTNAFSNTQLLSGVVDQQTYTITETPTAGFALSAINCTGTTTAVTDLANHQVAITFHAGDNVVCTFVNDQQGSITIAKDAVPDSPATFDFTAAPLTPAAFTLDDDGDNTNAFSNTQLLSGVVDQQTYTITEAPTAGYELSAVNCTGTTAAVTDLANHQVAITFHAGDNVVCTFVNDAIPGTIVIQKDSVPDGPTTFDFTAAPPLTPSSFTLDDDGDNTNAFSNTQLFAGLAVGVPYTITETPAPGFVLTTPVVCTQGVNVTRSGAGSSVTITLQPGQGVTCLFENVQQATITVVKNAVPNGTGTFDFTASAPLTPASFTLDDDGDNTNTFSNMQTFTDVAPGLPYVITETPSTGYVLGKPIACTGGAGVTQTTNGVRIVPEPGEHVTCTFVNSQIGGTSTEGEPPTTSPLPPPPAPPPPVGVEGSGTLPVTGSDTGLLLGYALGTLALGGGLRLSRRRRRAGTSGPG